MSYLEKKNPITTTCKFTWAFKCIHIALKQSEHALLLQYKRLQTEDRKKLTNTSQIWNPHTNLSLIITNAAFYHWYFQETKAWLIFVIKNKKDERTLSLSHKGYRASLDFYMMFRYMHEQSKKGEVIVQSISEIYPTLSPTKQSPSKLLKWFFCP